MTIHETVESIYNAMMKTSRLGLKEDREYIKLLIDALSLYINNSLSQPVIYSMDFIHPLFIICNFEKKLSYTICLEGVSDRLRMFISHNPEDYVDGCKGFRFINLFSTASKQNSFDFIYEGNANCDRLVLSVIQYARDMLERME